MMGTIEMNIATVNTLKEAVDWRAEITQEKRENFASLCDDISNIFQTYADASDDRQQSIKICAELRVYVPKFRDIVEIIRDKELIEQMANQLENACNNWGDPNNNSIIEAAGSFHGLANVVRKTA